MSVMSPDKAEQWEKTRTKGKWRYILLHGLFYSIGFMVVMGLFQWIRTSKIPSDLLSLLLFLFLGFMLSFAQWWKNDADYQNYILDQKIHKGLEL